MPRHPNEPRPVVDPRLVAAVRLIEQQLGVPVFCLIHHRGGDETTDEISPWLYRQILGGLSKLPRGKPIALLLHSPGGDAHSAFRIARTLTRHCGEFYVIIPRYAKSAATLLSLGAAKIYFGEHAEFGPIDVQLDDFEQERQISALEMVQSLERLNSEAMQAMDAMMSLLVHRSRKRIDSLLPSVLKYAAEVTRPIFEKIDTISFTFHARLLKIGEDYARLLLQSQKRYSGSAEAIAIILTRGYPDHGFVIDFDEASRIGLDLEPIPDNLREPIGPSLPSYTKGTVVGFLEDAPDAAKAKNAPAPGSTRAPATPGKPARRNGGQRRTGNRVGKNGPP
jgi:hypothetical protein